MTHYKYIGCVTGHGTFSLSKFGSFDAPFVGDLLRFKINMDTQEIITFDKNGNYTQYPNLDVALAHIKLTTDLIKS